MRVHHGIPMTAHTGGIKVLSPQIKLCHLDVLLRKAPEQLSLQNFTRLMAAVAVTGKLWIGKAVSPLVTTLAIRRKTEVADTSRLESRNVTSLAGKSRMFVGQSEPRSFMGEGLLTAHLGPIDYVLCAALVLAMALNAWL